MPIDPNIPLQAGNPSGPFGPDLKQIITLQNLAQQMQARQMVMQQEQQGQNALRQVFSNPENIDKTGLPKPNALAPVMMANPEMGMNMLKGMSTIQHNQVLQGAQQGKLFQNFQQAGADAVSEALSEYDQTVKTAGPEQAQRVYQEAWKRNRDQVASSGAYAPDWVSKIPVQAPPIEEARRRKMAWDASQATPLTEAQKIDIGFKAEDLDLKKNKERREIITSERGAVDKPDDIEVTKPDGTKEITVGVFDKDKKQYVSADGSGKPIEGKVRKVSSTEGASPQAQAFKAYLAQNPNATPADMQHFLSQGFRPRSGQSAAVMKYMEENPNASADDIAKFVAGVGAQVSATRAFMSGKQGDAIRSFSVADSHLDVMQEAADALKNNDIQTLNRLSNVIKTEFGHEGPVDFNFVRSIVGAEVTKAIIGGAGSLTDREELRGSFDKANSPEQLAGVARFARKLIGGQLEGYRRQFKNSTKGSDEDFNALLSDAARRDLPEPGAAGAPASGAPSAPQGSPAPAGQAAVKAGSLDATPEQYKLLPGGAPYTIPGNPKIFYKQQQ